MAYTGYLLFLAIRSRKWQGSVREGLAPNAATGATTEKQAAFGSPAVPTQQPYSATAPVQPGYPPHTQPLPGSPYPGPSPAPTGAQHPGYGQV